MIDQSTIARFNKLIKRRKGKCWKWLGTKGTGGYGLFHFTHEMNGTVRRMIAAHRLMWMITHNNFSLTRWEIICHECDSPECTNPKHLLKADTRKNTQDAIDRKLWTPVYGEKHGRAKLTEENVKRIIQKLPYKTQAQIAREFNVNPATIADIYHNRKWKHIPRK